MKLGVLIKTLGISQLGFNLAQEGGALTSKRRDIDLTIFYNDHDKIPMFPKFSMIQSNQIWGYTGPIIATDIELAKTLLKCPSPSKKYLYMWNLEWLYVTRQFRELSEILLDDSLNIVVRSWSHSEIFTKCWGKQCDIMEDFDNEQLAKFAS